MITDKLSELREYFVANGFDLRLVGGCVRDTLLGLTPKDIDFCTDATPDEQAAIYAKNGIEHIPTGLQHGTWTIVLRGAQTGVYEITSLRTETDHDGRHAKVAWTRDWNEDLSRRDLTFNAMAMSFDGELFDPFNGKDDLENGRVRFVGNAAERMKEDFLRILRFVRFQARFSNGQYDQEALDAINDCAPGLADISRERVWSEVSRIVSGNQGPAYLAELIRLGIGPYIDLPNTWSKPSHLSLARAYEHTKDPASLMAAYLSDPALVLDLAAKWRWSKEERQQALYIIGQPLLTLKDAKWRVAVDGDPIRWVAETMRVQYQNVKDVAELLAWEVPKMPVNGNHLISLGYIPGLQIKEALATMKTAWGESDYTLGKEELLVKL